MKIEFSPTVAPSTVAFVLTGLAGLTVAIHRQGEVAYDALVISASSRHLLVDPGDGIERKVTIEDITKMVCR